MFALLIGLVAGYALHKYASNWAAETWANFIGKK